MNFRDLYSAIAAWRQGGSTRASWEAVSRYDGVLIVATQDQKKHLVNGGDSRNGNVVTLGEVEHGALHGRSRRGPIIVDHHAVTVLIAEAHSTQGELREEVAWRTLLHDGLKEVINAIAFDGRIAELGEIKTFSDVQGVVRAVKNILRDRDLHRRNHASAVSEVERLKAALECIAGVWSPNDAEGMPTIEQRMRAKAEEALGRKREMEKAS